MASKVSPIPEGYSTVTPYMIFKGASKAIEFYKEALGAEEIFRMDVGDGKISHAEIQIGDAKIMLADEHPHLGYLSAQTLNGSPVNFMIYVKDVDATAKQALKAGMTVKQEIANQFYGDRTGTFLDPFGYQWTIATHIENVSPEEAKKRAAEQYGFNEG